MSKSLQQYLHCMKKMKKHSVYGLTMDFMFFESDSKPGLKKRMILYMPVAYYVLREINRSISNKIKETKINAKAKKEQRFKNKQAKNNVDNEYQAKARQIYEQNPCVQKQMKVSLYRKKLRNT